MAQQYRKKPVVVEAVRWTGTNTEEVGAFFGPDACSEWGDVEPREGEPILIETLEGNMTAQPGDWIIRGVAGELYPCKPDIFDATYEPVTPDA